MVIKDAFSRFLKLESFSGIVLFFATAVALIIANSPLRTTYLQFLDIPIGIKTGDFSLIKPLILWINDGLMAIFFFVIGLEIKREIIAGELSSLRKSGLPIIAAIGGMVMPALFFLLLENNGEASQGWGIPMATDIAFSLGILSLLGNRVPLSIKIFLTAFAIIDDLGAVLIIAFFYSGNINWIYLIIAAVIYVLILMPGFLKLNLKYIYLPAGIVIWYLFLKTGIHPTLAGVLLAFAIPATRKIGKISFANELKEIAHEYENLKSSNKFLEKPQIELIEQTEDLLEDVRPQLQHLEYKLHPWIAFLIMPVFALANAGVELNADAIANVHPVAWHIALAMILGKVSGISLFAFAGLKLRIIELPDGISMKHIFAVSFLGAVGFTMALFINGLAFDDLYLKESAKIGILFASLVSGIIGYILMNQFFKKE